MVNNSESRSRHKNGEKCGSERQKLADELSFLAGLISKHKEKPAAKESKYNASGNSSNQFSWTKEEASSSSQSSKTSAFHKQGQRSQGPSCFPSKDSLTWKKVKERRDGPLTTSATRYKYVSKDVHRTAIERGKNASCGKGKADVCKEEKPSSETAIGQRPAPKQNVQARRIVIPPQGSKSLLKPTKTSSENSKAGLPSSKPMLVKSEGIGKADPLKQGITSRTATSVKPELEGSSSESHRHSNNRRYVIPPSQKTSVASALKPVANLDVRHGLSRNVGKQTIVVKPSPSLSQAQTSTDTATKIILPEQSTRIVQPQKQPAEHPNAKVLATLSKELDKCLGDIARLKDARTQLKDGKSVSTAGIRKAAFINVRHTNSEIKSPVDGNQKVRSSQGSILKPSNTKEEQKDSKCEKNAAGTASSAAATSSDYKWVAPKVKSEKVPSSHVKNINKTNVESADSLTQKKNVQVGAQIGTGMNSLNTGLNTMTQISSPRVKVIRTRYKMKKQLSTASTPSLISRHKVDRRNSVGASAMKSTENTNVQTCDVKISRYRLVKSSSHPGELSQKHPDTSSLSPHKQQIAINTRYKKVKGHPPALGSPVKPAIVIPHRSQLKLNRIKTKLPHKNTPKMASTSTTTRKQSRHKIGNDC
ncbi:protein stum [Strongylocentrotus purpuratus]|uniref:Uncharacterized protein n=1 Tax=Strongylocentrotus purpuratus TaxID=7668 RepID=A0A7M7N601_STRPU|nr:protein stum [Strongylocentrotus purpuratus]